MRLILGTAIALSALGLSVTGAYPAGDTMQKPGEQVKEIEQERSHMAPPTQQSTPQSGRSATPEGSGEERSHKTLEGVDPAVKPYVPAK